MAIGQLDYFRNELSDWKTLFQFFKDELRIFHLRLAEVVERNSKKRVLGYVEHFQNQFIIQNEEFDILKQEIHRLESGVEDNFKREGTAFSEEAIKKRELLREKVHLSEKIFLETKHEFYRFLARVF